MNEWGRLRRDQENKPTLEYVEIEDVRSDLLRTLRASICECSSCGKASRDMMYNASMKEWFCTQCVQEYRDYYLGQKTVYGDLADDRDFYETFF